jgi:hypothetical protein
MKGTWIAALAVWLAGSGSALGQTTFSITQIFSDLDGGIQYIVLTEMAGLNDQQHFSGLTITSTYNGVAHQFTFANDLASSQTAHVRIVLAAGSYLNDDGKPTFNTFTACCSYSFTADYALPERFLGTAGGTIDFAGIDRFTYAGMPADGVNALNRDGTIAPTSLLSAPRFVSAIEYENAVLGRHFLTAKGAEIDLLDRGLVPGWLRTGQSFVISGTMHNGDIEYHYIGAPICAASLPGLDTAAPAAAMDPATCNGPSGQYAPIADDGDIAFYAAQIDPTTGECPTMLGFIDGDIPTSPVYRVVRTTGTADVRYVRDFELRNQMIGQGWLPRGSGALGIAWCSR